MTTLEGENIKNIKTQKIFVMYQVEKQTQILGSLHLK